MKLVPLGDRVVIKAVLAEETTKSGIVLPGQAKEKPQQAEVVAVGPGGVVEGKEVTMQVKPGDKVLYSKYAGTDPAEGAALAISIIEELKSRDARVIHLCKKQDNPIINEFRDKEYGGKKPVFTRGYDSRKTHK